MERSRELALAAAFLAASTLLGQSAIATQTTASAEKGNEVFDEQCASCHHAYDSDRKIGPSLQFLFGKEKLQSNGKPVNDANVLELIAKGAKGMPAFKDGLSEDDKADLLAYLRTL